MRLTYSVQECATLLGVSTDLVYDMAWRGVLPSAKVGRRLLISGQGLKDLLEQRFGSEVGLVDISIPLDNGRVPDQNSATKDRTGSEPRFSDLLERLALLATPPLPPPPPSPPPPPPPPPQSPTKEPRSRQPEPLLSITEVGEWLGLSPATLYTWRSRRIGPTAVRVGRRLRYRREDVQAWIDSR